MTEWATSADIPAEQWAEMDLPRLGRRVRVRFLRNTEATALAFLPDLGLADIVAKAMEPTDGEPQDPAEMQATFTQNQLGRTRYMVRLVHMCVMAGTDLTPAPCSCGFDHPRSLWTMEQAEFVPFEDLIAVTRVAEQEEAMAAVRPFSTDATPSSSESPVDTGESIPQTSS